ncbi:hypothetical protein [Pedococcus bigeumensis]|uniref:Uncharacterized protein n=1 Tax=Pedococcus bigeumensis TaxID=433644 RepID=A0A502CZ03_9MICO|nr:hypothetical protein [Pedococcus bigeumensis]TPG18128.1 hypothetical protein EAH86_06930 [Pedococcus bigeumensis]
MNTSFLAVVVAVIGAFVISAVWYAAWGRSLPRLHPAYAEGAARPPAALAAIHLGDWLLKLLAICSVLSVWP